MSWPRNQVWYPHISTSIVDGQPQYTLRTSRTELLAIIETAESSARREGLTHTADRLANDANTVRCLAFDHPHPDKQHIVLRIEVLT